MMLQRNLVYTAITRGRKRVFVVGEPAAWGMAVRNAESKLRCTHLKEKITSGFVIVARREQWRALTSRRFREPAPKPTRWGQRVSTLPERFRG